MFETREQWETFRDSRVCPAVAAVLEQLGFPAPTQPPVEHVFDLIDVGVGRVASVR